MKLIFGLVCALAASTAAHAQAPQRIVGNQISGNMKFDGASQLTVDTRTVTFSSREGEPFYTIDFVARHPATGQVAAPGVVDMIVTQHAAGESEPSLTVRADGDAIPVIARPHSSRSVVASMSLEEFDRLTTAGTVVETAFGVELELGPAQLRMLRATADRWTGRSKF